MNTTSTQYTSGGESGWTLYLDNSSVSKDQFGHVHEHEHEHEYEEEENEDSSMVSDASSGPRYYCEDDENSFGEAKRNKNKNKMKLKWHQHQQHKQQQHSCLDDTASSPVFGFQKKNLSLPKNEASTDHVLGGFSQGYSATQFKDKTPFRKSSNFLKSSKPAQPASQQQGGYNIQGKWK